MPLRFRLLFERAQNFGSRETGRLPPRRSLPRPDLAACLEARQAVGAADIAVLFLKRALHGGNVGAIEIFKPRPGPGERPAAEIRTLKNRFYNYFAGWSQQKVGSDFWNFVSWGVEKYEEISAELPNLMLSLDWAYEDKDWSDVLALAKIARMSEGPEREAFRKAGEALGFTLGSLFALIDPAPLAFVGVGASVFDLMEPSLRTALASTVGGQHANAITLTTETDEKPLIREGTAKRALDFIDRNVIATSNIAANTGRSSTSS